MTEFGLLIMLLVLLSALVGYKAKFDGVLLILVVMIMSTGYRLFEIVGDLGIK